MDGRDFVHGADNEKKQKHQDIPHYQELSTYFKDRKRVGLVQVPGHTNFYLVPNEKELFLNHLDNFLSDEDIANIPETTLFILVQVPEKKK